MPAVVVDAEKWTTGSPVNYLMGIGNHDYTVYNAGSGYRYDPNATWAVKALAPEVIRFEVRSGDTVAYDIGSGKERSEVSSNEYISYGQPFHISYKFTVEPGPKNTTVWVVVGQFHDLVAEGEEPAPPSFGIELKGEKMMATVRYRDADGVVHSTRIFLDTDDIVRGKEYSIDIYGKFSMEDDGRLVMVRDDKVIGDYTGKFGYGSTGQTYWQYGIYRYGTQETLAAIYAKMGIDIGDAVEIPASGQSTHSPAVAPILTFDSIENNGDSVVARFKGVAAANSVVKIFDGDTLIATVTADQYGHYSADIRVSNATHYFTSAYLDGSGHLSRTSSELPIDSGPAADVMGRMNYLVAMDSLKAIVLTDTHSLPVGSVAEMKALIAKNAATLSLIKDGYNFSFWSGFDTYRTLSIYDKTGSLVEKNTISSKDGDILNIVHNVYKGVDFVNLEIANFHITGQAYSWAFRQFDTAGRTVTYETYRDNGSLVAANYILKDGTKVVRSYDGAGVMTAETITLANGDVRQISYVNGEPTTALVTHADGSRETVDARDGSLTVNVHATGPVDRDALAKVHFGDDIYIVRTGDEIIAESEHGGLDQVYTALQRFTLNENVETLVYAGVGDAVLKGNATDNLIKAGSGNDVLNGLAGADTMIGYAGDDAYIVDNKGDLVVEAVGGGNDVVHSSISYALTDNVERLTLIGGDDIDAAGNSLDNKLVGNDGDNRLDGRAGADIMEGGAGDDIYIVDNAGDVVREDPSSGDDTVYASVDFSLGRHIERLVLTGSADLSATGNSGDNTLIGNDGNNVIDGKGGADLMRGGKGDDTYFVDDVNDVVVEHTGEGTDTVISSLSYVLDANVENLTLVGSQNLFATGNSKDNLITGNAGNNILNGGAGADLLVGLGGDDVYIVDNAGDVVSEDLNGGDDRVISSVSYTLSDNVERLFLAGSDAISATGNELDNTLVGNDAANTLDGRAGADVMVGGGGDDLYIVDDVGDVTIENAGEGANDEVRSSVSFTLALNIETLRLTGSANIDATGNGEANRLIGNAGDNVLDGQGGADVMVGGEGDDTYVVDDAGDVIIETGDGNDDLVFSSISFTLGDNLERLTLTGDAAISGTGNNLDNIIFGNDANNVIDGGAGADRMAGGLGNDTYIVDQVGDRIIENAGGGDDLVQSSVSFTLSDDVERLTLVGSRAIDATGNALNNTLIGNSGANRIDGGAGADLMIGGNGNDVYIVDSAADLIVELDDGGYDTVMSSASYILADYVEALTLTGADNTSATGNALDNLLLGNDGNNVLDGGLGADEMKGGLGDDIYIVDNSGDRVVEGADRGDDLVRSRVSYQLTEHVERLTLIGSEAINGSGNGLANTIIGNAANNVLDGGAGADTLIGGTGNDTYVVDSAGDVVVEREAGGDDLVRSAVSYSLTENVERLTLTGSAMIDGFGNGLANVITGNDAANVLDGGAGNDVLIGGSGDDVYVVDSAGDQVIEQGVGDIDTVRSSVSFVLSASLENLVLTGSANINATGNAAANILTGNGGDNILDGGAGADIMTGGAGNDTYVVDSSADLVVEEAKSGIDTVRSSLTSYTLTANVERLISTTASSATAIGNALDNTIITGRGADKIDGGAGADEMAGGAGNDTYTVDNVNDKVFENAGEGVDRILATVSYVLTDNVEDLLLLAMPQAIRGTGNILDNTITGNGYANVLNGGGGKDILVGGLGNDSFEFSFGEADGDQVSDFAGAGSAVGDKLIFSGYGAGTLTQIGSTDRYIITADAAHGSVTEIIRLSGVTNLDVLTGAGHNDIFFV